MAPPATMTLGSMAGHSVQPVPMREAGSIAAMSNPMFKGDPPRTGAWADCAYDPETPGPICHPGITRVPLAPSLRLPTVSSCLSDMICVNVNIDDVLRLYTKAVLREQPEDLVEWSRQWFTARAAEHAAAIAAVTETQQ